MKPFLAVFFMVSLFFIAVRSTTAQQQILINEFVIDHSPQLVELINISTQSADISGWYIDDSGGSTYFTIPPSTILYPNSCLVFEGDFNLNKSTADTLRLLDTTAPPTAVNSSLVDAYSYKSSPGSGYSYMRIPDGSADWTMDKSSLGLFNSTGENCVVYPTTTPSPTPSLTPVPTIASTPTGSPSLSITPYPDYNNILINEVYPYPAAGEKEWVELYNNNDFEVYLEDWFIDDAENAGGTPKHISVLIPSYGYAVIELNTSLFNNGGDSVRLLDPNYLEKDGFEYVKAQKERSFGRISADSDIVCLEEASKGAINSPCINTLSPTSTQYIATIAPTRPIYSSSNISTYTLSVNAGKKITSLSKPVVLGESTNDEPFVTPSGQAKTVPYLASVSFSYSILTIISVLIKIRNGLAT